MTKPVILTGLRANNDLHLGNYLGALLPMIDMAKKHAGDYQVNLFIPDLHSFTTPIDHSRLQTQIMNNLRQFVAAGFPLDHPDIYLYRQSYVPAHSELTWIFDCFTGFGEMQRMTQFKDKRHQLLTTHDGESLLADNGESIATGDEPVSVGLFNYPALMAADILLYGAQYVPVGDDQTQHLEYTRDIAERMSTKFGRELFVIPKPVKEQHEFFGKDQGLRIKNLSDPTKKMSKSDESARGVIFLSDDPETARKKIMSATTDSFNEVGFDFEKRPGVSNLLQILALLSDKPLQDMVKEYEGHSQYGPLKEAVAEVVANFLKAFQAKLAKVDESAIMAKLEASEAAMNQVANKTLSKVQRAVGLRPKQEKHQPDHGAIHSKPSAIGYEDFAKLDIRIATVLSAEHAKGSDKLLRLRVADGSGERQIMTATREHFPDPGVLAGKQLPILINLASRNFKGYESQGMFLCADVNGRPVLVTPVEPIPDGSPFM